MEAPSEPEPEPEAAPEPEVTPEPPKLEAGKAATIRGALGDALGYLNTVTKGAVIACAADLAESTSVSPISKAFAKGWFHAKNNPVSRLISVGGICEDAMGGVMAGASSLGLHIGVSSSYSAFIAALEHVPARLHSIGQQMRHEATGEPYRAWIMVNAHAGPLTGEDGPTHACPQALQLLQDNFPKGSMITLTPWDPSEVWPLLMASLSARPAVLAPFVTRPACPVPDRVKLGLPPASAATKGVYAVRRGGKATVVLQGHGVAHHFMRDVLPALDAAGVKLNVFYVASAERLRRAQRRREVRGLPSRAGLQLDGHHGLHLGHALALGALRRRPGRLALSAQAGLPGQRLRGQGPGAGRPDRTRTAGRDHGLGRERRSEGLTTKLD